MGKIYSLLLILIIFSSIGKSQAIVSTTHTSNNGQNGVTFNVKNTTSDTITIVSAATVYNVTNATAVANLEVWYMTSPINGTPPLPIVTGSTWTLAGKKTITGTSTTVPSEVNCIEIKIPKDSTFGFWIGGETTADPAIGYMTITTTGVNSFTSNGVSILTGTNISYGGNKTALPNTPRGLVGYVKFLTKDSCTGKPTPGVISGPSNFCVSETQCHILSGASFGQKGLQYNWYSAPSPTGPFTFIQSGFNKSSLINSSTYYKCVLTCTYSGLKDSTPVFRDTMKNFFTCYCPSTASSTADTKIDSVSFLTTKTGTDTSVCQAYTSYLSLPAPKIRRGFPITFDVKNGSCSSSFFNGFGRIYVDWNKNAVFEATESVGTFSNLATARRVHRLITTSVPVDATPGVTMVRIMYYQSAPTSGCFNNTFGETEDYRLEIIQDSVDISVFNIKNEGGCEKATDSLTFSAKNSGKTSLTSTVFAYSLDGGAPVIQTFGGISADSTKTFTFTTPYNITSYGNHTLKVWSINLADSLKSNDTLTKSFYNFQTPTPPIVKNDTICNGTPVAILGAVSTAPFVTSWYADSACTILVNSGNSYTISNPKKDTTFYVKTVNKLTTFFSEDSSKSKIYYTGSGDGLVFDVLSPDLKINSVDVYIDSGVSIGIEIRDPSNNIITNTLHTSTVYGLNRVNINASLTTGVGYKILISSNTGLVTCTNVFKSFPISITNGVTITGSTIAGYYLNFYNWNITYEACQSTKEAVKAVYLPLVYAPKALLNNTYSGCLFPGITLDAGNIGFNYLWSTSETSRIINPTTSGTYMLTVSNQYGCKAYDTTTVTVNPPLSFSIPSFITGCFGDSIIIASGYSNAGYSHRWSTENKNPYSFDPSINPQQSGRYYLTVINSNINCGGIDSVDVIVNPRPVVNLGLDTSSCNNQSIDIVGPTGIGYQYKWQDNSSNYKNTVTSTKNVWLEVTDINGCKNTDSVFVTISTLTKPNLGNDVVSCGNYVPIGVPPVNNVIYDWNNGKSGSNIVATLSGAYVLKALENGTRCSFLDTVNVTFLPGQTLNLGPDINTCGTKVTLTADNGWKSYTWNNGAFTQSIDVTTSNWYVVSATNDCGQARDSIYVKISQPTSVSLPNDTTICRPITVSIPNQNPADTIRWSNGTVNVTSMTISQPGHYWVSIKNGCGVSSDAMEVRWDSIPTADFSPTINEKFVSFKNLSTHGVSYFWDFGDSKYSTYFNAANYYDSVKQYSVKLTVKNGCGDSASITKIIVTDSTLRTTNNPSSILSTNIEGLRVYPNPTKSTLNISSANKPINRIELYAQDGRKLLDIDNKNIKNKDLQVNLESLSSGHYLLKIISEEFYQFEKIEIIK